MYETNQCFTIKYHTYLLIVTETLDSMVDQIKVLVNLFDSEKNVEVFEDTEVVAEGMYSYK